MIVNPIPKGWEIIFQRAHALLAAKLAYQLDEQLRTDDALWLEMLDSIAEHDDGQPDWHHRNHLTEAGAPKDLTQQKYNLEQARKVVSESAQTSRWIALMASLHTYHLHRSFQGDSQELDAFLQDQLDYQKSIRKTLSITKEESEEAYTLMRWCDECSLVLCKSQIPPQGKKLEIGSMPAGTTRFIFKLNDHTCITPWPFKTNSFELSVEYYTVEQLVFENDEELRQALSHQSPRVRCWRMATE